MNQLAALRRGAVSAARRSSGLLLLAAHLASLNVRANVINWTNLNGGSWNAPFNWSPNTVPTPGDDVLIAAAGNYSVTQDVHITIASLTLGSSSGTQTLINPGLSLTLNGASVVTTNGVLGLDGGTLGGAGALSVDGKAVWTGGTIVGEFTIATNGVLNINGSATKSLSGTGTIVNYGSVAWSGPSDIQTANCARIINEPGALFDIQNNQSIAVANGGAITNLGTVRKSSGGGTTLITVPLFNFGTLEVQSGLVAYAGGSQFNTGTVFTGTGTNLVYTGTITFDGAISSENLEIAGATIAGNSLFSGVVNWTSGALGSGGLTIASNSVLTIRGSETKYLSGTGTLINYGLVAWSGTNDIQTGNYARIINEPGALFDIQNNQSLVVGNGGAITNLGTLRKSAGGATTFLTVPLFNFGTLDVASGVLAYAGGSQFNPGTVFTGTGTNLVYTGTITFDGAIPSENLQIAGAIFGGNSTFSGVVRWTSGTLGGGVLIIATNGILIVEGSEAKSLSGTGTLVNYGAVAWSGPSDIQTANYARIINQPGALFDIQNNQSLAIANGGAITNLGTLRKSAGGATTVITVPLFNFGTLEVQSGLVAYAGGSQFNSGTAFIGTGTNLVYAGTITFDGAIRSENLEIAGATIAGNSLFSGVVNWTSGTLGSGGLTIASNSVLTIRGSETKYLSGTGTLINYGLVAWSGTNDIQTGNYARIINQPGALFDIQNNQSLAIANGGTITNLGTLRKSAGGATTLISVPLFNFGTLEVESGLVAYGGGSQFNPGTAFTGTGTNLVYTGTVTFNGAIPSENLEIAGAAFGGNSIFSGVVNWSSGTLADDSVFTVASNGLLHISGSVDKDLGGAITNLGLVVWSGTNNLTTFRAARIINQPGALFDIQNNQSLAIWNGGAITNLGTVRKSAGGQNTVISLPLNNAGTVDVQSGTITFGTYKQNGGKLSFGLNSLTNFGRVAFANSVALTGALGVSLNGGYIPVAGNAFALITYPSRSGAFTDFDLPATHAWQTNSSIYGATVLTLAVLNTRPTLSLIADRTMDEQVQLAFLITGSDPDPGQSLSYSLRNPPAGATVNTNTGYFTWTPDETQGPSTNLLSVQVTDNGAPSLTATRVFTVVVNEVNLAPVLMVPPTQTVDELTTLSVTNFATDSDIPANTLSFSLLSAPPGVTLNTNTGVLNWTPGEAQSPSTNTIMVAVTDNGTPALGMTNHFTVIVLESNVPPILAWIPDLTAVQDVLLLYTNCATDADLPANSLRFYLAAFPPGMTMDATNGVLRWIPSGGQVPSTNLVTVRVTDNGQPAKTDIKNFSVVAYPLPFLTIAKVQTNAVLSWPAYATGFTLQQADELNPPVFWADMTNAVAVEGGRNLVTNRADAPRRCFRLHYGSGSSRP